MYPHQVYYTPYRGSHDSNSIPPTPLDLAYGQSMLPRQLLVGSPFISTPGPISPLYTNNPQQGSASNLNYYYANQTFIGPPPPKLNFPAHKKNRYKNANNQNSSGSLNGSNGSFGIANRNGSQGKKLYHVSSTGSLTSDSAKENKLFDTSDSEDLSINTKKTSTMNLLTGNSHKDSKEADSVKNDSTTNTLSNESVVNPSTNINLNLSRNLIIKNVNRDLSVGDVLDEIKFGPIEYCRLIKSENLQLEDKDKSGNEVDGTSTFFISFLNSLISTNFHQFFVDNTSMLQTKLKSPSLKILFNKSSILKNNLSSLLNNNQEISRCIKISKFNCENESLQPQLTSKGKDFGTIEKAVISSSSIVIFFTSIDSALKFKNSIDTDETYNDLSISFDKDRCDQIKIESIIYPSTIQDFHPSNMVPASLSLHHHQQMQQQQQHGTSIGLENLGNRTVYLGNLHPDTTVEEICNGVRGGLLQTIRLLPAKKICFVTFVDHNSSLQFFINYQLNNLIIHNRKIKVGWGNHSGDLPNNVRLAVTAGASRNVYVGNVEDDDSATYHRIPDEDTLRNDFRRFGEIEQINFFKDGYCGFVNFTNINAAIKVVDLFNNDSKVHEIFGGRYSNFKISFGKDRCGNPPKNKTSKKKGKKSNGDDVNNHSHGKNDSRDVNDHRYFDDSRPDGSAEKKLNENDALIFASMGITSGSSEGTVEGLGLKTTDSSPYSLATSVGSHRFEATSIDPIEEENEFLQSDSESEDEDGISILINSSDIPSPKSLTNSPPLTARKSYNNHQNYNQNHHNHSHNHNHQSGNNHHNYNNNGRMTMSRNNSVYYGGNYAPNYGHPMMQQAHLQTLNYVNPFQTSGSQVMAQYLAQTQHENYYYAAAILGSDDGVRKKR